MASNSKDLQFKISQEGASKVSSDIEGIGKTTDSLKSRFTSLAETSGKVGVGLTAIGAVGTAAIMSLVDAAAEAEAGQKMLEHAVVDVSHGTAEQVQQLQDLAAQVMKNGVLDDDAIIRGQAQLSTFGLQTQSVMDLTQSMADLAVNQYGVSAGGAELEASANMISKALRGEFGVLEKSGIIFTDAQKQMVLYGTEAEKVAAIQEGFSQNLKYTNEVAAQTFEGAMANLQNQFGSFQETLGTALIPALVQFGEILGGVAEWLNNLSPATTDFIAKVLLIGTAVAAIAGPFLIFISMIPSLMAGLSVLAAAFMALISPLGLIVIAVAAVAAAIYFYWDEIVAATKAVGDFIVDIFTAAWDWVKERVTDFVEFFIAGLEFLFAPQIAMYEFITGGWTDVWETVKGLITGFRDFFVEAWNWLVEAATTAMTAIQDFFIAAWEYMKQFLIDTLDFWLGIFGTNTEEILALWDTLWSSFTGVITTYVGGIKEAINGIVTYLTDKVSGIITMVQNAWNTVNSLVKSATEAVTSATSDKSSSTKTSSTKRLATGGIVTGPTMALIGEGAYNEAVVPLPDGRRIPVEMRGGQAGGGRTIILHQGDVTINNKTDVDAYFAMMKKRFIEELQLTSLGSITA